MGHIVLPVIIAFNEKDPAEHSLVMQQKELEYELCQLQPKEKKYGQWWERSWLKDMRVRQNRLNSLRN